MADSFPYEKWDATGNDFVVVELSVPAVSRCHITADLVSLICDRHQGVGADGVVLVSPSSDGAEPTEVVIWNSDGSQAEMCGNALRCVALLLARSAPAGSRQTVSIGGRVVLTRPLDDGHSCVQMGLPTAVTGCALFDSLPELDEVLGGRGWLVSFGNPHYVVPFQQLPSDWAERGARAQEVADRLLATGGINCGFLQVVPECDGSYLLRVYERGVGVTKSCGSGACAASAVLENKLGVAPSHLLSLIGGRLTVGRDAQGGFELAGPARMEFEGHWRPE